MDQRAVDKKKKKKIDFTRAKILNRLAFNPKTYEMDDSFTPWDGRMSPLAIHSLPCLLKYFESDAGKNCQLDARFFVVKQGEAYLQRANKEKFIKILQGNKRRSFKETIDAFS